MRSPVMTDKEDNSDKEWMGLKQFKKTCAGWGRSKGGGRGQFQ